tara:strand:- start:1038 stop:1724 length:687 start_codon:yes stop_codon:yes gene_type:complete
MNDLTLIIPAKNEIESIDIVLDEIIHFDKNLKILIVVDDVDDNTFQSKYSKENLFKNINFIVSKYPSYSGAVRYGVEKSSTKFCCIFNADGSFLPSSLKDMYGQIFEYDFVYCSRYKKNGSSDDDTILTYVGNKIFTLMGNILFNVKITDILYSYVMFNRQKFISLNLTSKKFNLALELPIKNAMNKSKYTDVSSHERKRFKGQKKVREFQDGFQLLIFMLNMFIKNF